MIKSCNTSTKHRQQGLSSRTQRMYPRILCPVKTTPEEFENAALFLRLGLPSTLIRHENGTFRKRFSNRGNLKTPALRFNVDGKIFKTELFENDDVMMIMWFPWLSFPQTQIQNDRWLWRFQINFLRRSADGKRLKRFQGETSVFKLIRRSVDGAQLNYRK